MRNFRQRVLNRQEMTRREIIHRQIADQVDDERTIRPTSSSARHRRLWFLPASDIPPGLQTGARKDQVRAAS
jgi:hypothetical protein